MPLNGWARLGIVISALYGLLVGAIAFNEMPSIEAYKSSWIYEASEATASALTAHTGHTYWGYEVSNSLLKNGTDEGIQMLWKAATTPSERQKVFSKEIGEVNKKYEQKIANISKERFHHWLTAFYWWLGGTTVLFAIGSMIGWVYRGFRKPHP